MPLQDVTDPMPLPVISKRRAAARKVGFASPICDLKEYSVIRAIAYAAATGSENVRGIAEQIMIATPACAAGIELNLYNLYLVVPTMLQTIWMV